VPRAQLFISQGVNLAWAFNHAEAARSFSEAARLDPNNPMAYWGHALVLGPNINASMEAADEPKALELAKKAQSLAAKATPRERAYITAVAARYTGKPEDRNTANRAFSDAMRNVVNAFPADLDARAIFAESLMNLRPWNYWTPDGVPYAETREVISSLEYILKRNPNHPGALHLWIHLWEPTDTPERAEAEADRLLTLMPGAGHIVHMPAHIYQRVGRHADVIKANELAAKADEDYIAQCRAQGCIRWRTTRTTCISSGWVRPRAAAASSRWSQRRSLPAACRPKPCPPCRSCRDSSWCLLGDGQVRAVGRDSGGPRPEARHAVYARRVQLRARDGVDRKDRLADADQELARLREFASDPALKGQTTFSSNQGSAILRIAPEVVAGELAQSARTGTAPCCIWSVPCGSRTRSSIRNLRTGTRLSGRRWAPCCSKQAARMKRKRSSGRTCGRTRERLGPVRPGASAGGAGQEGSGRREPARDSRRRSLTRT
jgi:tetratricopeptide (TPR) repeat protein